MPLTETAWLERFNGRTCVYQAFGADGGVLYVGVSWSWPRRWQNHAEDLVAHVVRLEVAWYETRQEALDVEAELIRTLQPPFNALPKDYIDRPLDKRYGYDRFLDDTPLPPPPPDVSREPTRTIDEIAPALGLEKKTVRNLLSEFRRELGPRAYRKTPHGYQLRLLSEADVYLLRAILARWNEAEAARLSRANSPATP